MKKDQSKRLFNFPGNIAMSDIINNPDEYIIPECIAACQSFWDKNIFTVSCSNRDEIRDEDGNINKFIMIDHLSAENEKKFKQLVELHPNNYRVVRIEDRIYYAIVISTKDIIEERDIDSQRLLKLTSEFEMQDCLVGETYKEYYLEHLTDPLTPRVLITIPNSDSELLELIKQNLEYKGKLDYLNIEEGLVYATEFHKNAHLRYLEYLKNRDEDENGIEI